MDELAGLYKTMRLIRRFEETVVELVNVNEIPGTTHEYIGQEAVAAGVCSVLTRDDYITSTHRGHGHCIAKGADVRRMMAELMARQTGLNRGRGGSMHVADFGAGMLGANGIVAGGVPFALGAVWARRDDGADVVAAAFFGDGAIGQGILGECLNLAALWALPVLFVCENNGYAVSLRVQDSVAGSLTARATSCGMPAMSVDGMDALAVQSGARTLMEGVRSGSGPAFLECTTYRYAGHHTAEASLKLTYRTPEEVEAWRARDPLTRAASLMNDDVVRQIDVEVEALIARALEFARSSPAPPDESALDFAYASAIGSPRGVEG
jgi:pyruvate dehydrogenase E1 component alpha subunit